MVASSVLIAVIQFDGHFCRVWACVANVDFFWSVLLRLSVTLGALGSFHVILVQREGGNMTSGFVRDLCLFSSPVLVTLLDSSQS